VRTTPRARTGVVAAMVAGVVAVVLPSPCAQGEGLGVRVPGGKRVHSGNTSPDGKLPGRQRWRLKVSVDAHTLDARRPKDHVS
jgi:hypothetical protein